MTRYLIARVVTIVAVAASTLAVPAAFQQSTTRQLEAALQAAVRTETVDGGTPTLLYRSEGDRIFNFAWSPNGELAIAHGPALTDIVMVSGVR